MAVYAPMPNTMDPMMSVCVDSNTSTQSYGMGDCTFGDVLLLGNYLQIGMNPSGSLGTTVDVDVKNVIVQLGMIVDFDMNGFGSVWRVENASTTTAYYILNQTAIDLKDGFLNISYPGFSGDIVTPGLPIEGQRLCYIVWQFCADLYFAYLSPCRRFLVGVHG
jgi:hypothetical protein